jgi:hypothetical protein
MSHLLNSLRPSLYTISIKAIVIVEKQYRSKNILLKTYRKDYKVKKEEYKNSLETLILKLIVLTKSLHRHSNMSNMSNIFDSSKSFRKR